MVKVQVFLACVLVLAPVQPSSSMCPKINSTLVTEKRLEAFKSSFLAKLKLERIPENPAKTINSLKDLSIDIRKSYEDAVNALVESYSGGCSHCSQCRVPGSAEDYYADVFTEVKGEVNGNGKTAEFPVVSKTRTSNMKQAKVILPLELPRGFQSHTRGPRDTSNELTVKIYLKKYGPANQTLSRTLVYERKYSQATDTIKIDVTGLLEDYEDTETDEDQEGHAVALEADVNTNQEIAISSDKVPRMTVISEIDSEGGRRKRQSDTISSDYCLETPQESRCCLRNLIIDFRKLGWKWVLWPKTLDIHYCSGACPYSWPNTAEKHPAVLRAYRTMNPTGAPEPCCSAQRIRGITAIVKKFVDKPPEVMNLSDMIIETCMCG